MTGPDRRLPEALLARLRAADTWLVDFDGTLTDYDAAHETALAALGSAYFPTLASSDLHAAAATGRTAYYRWAATHGVGPGLDAHLVGGLLAGQGRPADDAAVACYRDALRAATVAAPGAVELLTALRSGGRAVAVVTNAYDADAQRRRVVGSGLADLVDTVVVAAEVGRFKPDPALLRAAADRLDRPVAGCAVLGDSVPFDLAPARALGLPGVLVAPADDADADGWVAELPLLEAVLSRPVR